MKRERILQFLPLLCLAMSALFIGSFAYSWAARILSTEQLHEIRGGSGEPTAVAKAQGVTTTATILKRQLVTFDGSASTGGDLTYYWDFGDLSTSSDSITTHRYSGTGPYTVSLTVSNNYGSHEDTVYVRGYTPYVVKVGFQGGDYRIQKIKSGQRVTIGPDNTDPVWDMMVVSPYTSMDAGDENDEVAYLKNADPILFKIKLWAGESPTTAKNLSQSADIALDAVGTGSLDFVASSVTVQNWPSNDFSLSSSAGGDDKFYNYVYKYNTFDLQWNYQVNGDAQVVSMSNNTAHKVFLLLAQPKSPWDYINDPPWVEVLDKACTWASQDTTASSAAQHITEKGYSLSGKEYDGSQSHAQGTTFDLTNFLADSMADCRDMSAWFHVLNGSIGVNSQVKRISYTTSGFYYKEILPVGKSQWDDGYWDFHQVGWYNSKVYDSCIKYDENPPNHQGKVPVNMSINGDYKDALYDSGTWDTSESSFYYSTIQ